MEILNKINNMSKFREAIIQFKELGGTVLVPGKNYESWEYEIDTLPIIGNVNKLFKDKSLLALKFDNQVFLIKNTYNDNPIPDDVVVKAIENAIEHKHRSWVRTVESSGAKAAYRHQFGVEIRPYRDGVAFRHIDPSKPTGNNWCYSMYWLNRVDSYDPRKDNL